MNPRFHFPGILPHAGDVELPAAAAHHALKVLRLADGDAVTLFDGSGGELEARLAVRARTAYAVAGRWRETGRESPFAIVLVQALVGGDKMDWAIQKAVELGVAGIVPLQAARSVPRLAGVRADKRLEHWRQVVVAACEQCGRNRPPFVAPVRTLAAYLDQRDAAMRLIFAPGGARLSTLLPLAAPVHLLVGPEGGWSEEERALCLRSGCRETGLGPRVLRTETAGLVAIAVLQAAGGDF
ncbi:MAG: 16S rRNA (uracil(1498)-N(3))-methyltransferase [Azoarcus sp.]|nr:16S rRNA (uracil(1498)-N(3))-methyltransferase [Azoarcus sp.]